MSRRFKTGTVARSVGVPAPLLRMWETRYGLVRPHRGPGGQRLYNEADIAVLRAVRVLVGRGYSIGEIASWPRNEILDTAQEQVRVGSLDDGPATTAPSALGAVIVAVDHEGIVSAVSPTVESLLGWPHTILVGQPLWGLLADVPAQLERLIVGDVSPAGGTICWVWMRTRSGGAIPCRFACGQRRHTSEGTTLTISITPLYSEGEAPLSSLIQNVAAGGLARFEGSPEEMLKDYVTTAVERHDATLARVWTYDAKSGTLHLVASAGISGTKTVQTSQRSVIRLSSYKFKVGVVARTGIPYVHNGLEADRDFDRQWIKRERLESAAVMPLVRDGELYGVAAQFFRKRLDASDIGKIQSAAALCEATLRTFDAPRRGRTR